MMTVLLKRLFLISQVAAFSVLAKDQSSLRKGGNIINQDKLDAVSEYDAFVSRQLSMSHSMPNEICFIGNCTNLNVGPKECTDCCPGGSTCNTTVLGGPCKCNALCVPKNTKCAPASSVGPFAETCSQCCSKSVTCPTNVIGGTCTCDCIPLNAPCVGSGSVGPNKETCSQCCSNKFTCPPNLPGGGCTCSL
mmetsp:Transcript_25982/g.37263  ORF Transcript_25982/g.37263 Transcript_25982/m.37263 type:complete len:192 (+) Transcript_25982:228-803(+)